MFQTPLNTLSSTVFSSAATFSLRRGGKERHSLECRFKAPGPAAGPRSGRTAFAV